MSDQPGWRSCQCHLELPQFRSLAAHNVAEIAVVDPLHQLLVLRLPSLLRPDHDGQFLLVGEIGRRQQRPDAHGIDGPGLFHEDVLARVHGGPQRLRAKAGRRQEQHGASTLWRAITFR